MVILWGGGGIMSEEPLYLAGRDRRERPTGAVCLLAPLVGVLGKGAVSSEDFLFSRDRDIKGVRDGPGKSQGVCQDISRTRQCLLG